MDGYTPGYRIQQYVRDALIAAVSRAQWSRSSRSSGSFGYDGSAVFFQHTLTDDAVIVEDVAALVLARATQRMPRSTTS